MSHTAIDKDALQPRPSPFALHVRTCDRCAELAWAELGACAEGRELRRVAREIRREKLIARYEVKQ